MEADDGSRGREEARRSAPADSAGRAAPSPPGPAVDRATPAGSSLEYSFGDAAGPPPAPPSGSIALPAMVGPAPPSRPGRELVPETLPTLPHAGGTLVLGPGPSAPDRSLTRPRATGTLPLEVEPGAAVAPASDTGPGGTCALSPGATDSGPPPRRSSGFAANEAPTLETCFAPEEAALTLEHVGRYAWLEGLGAGGVGRVSVVFDRHLEREIAVKELHPGLTGTAAGRSAGGSRTPAERRFVNEARITGQLEHPAIVPVYELGRRHDGTLYYTMRRVRGRTLGEALAGRDFAGRLELLPQVLAVCNAVAFAHARGVVHRDLKPENVMIGDYGETVVLDWGLAKRREGEDLLGGVLAAELGRLRGEPGQQTVAGVPLGTPAYMSPEQASGDLDQIDERSDVYSLGALLYEVGGGAPPFQGGDAWEIVRAVLAGPSPSPRAREPRCPRELAAIVERALARERAARYPDARALAGDLSAFLTGGLVGAHRYGWFELGRRWVRRHAAALAAVAALLAVGAGAWWYRGLTQARAAAAEEAARVTAVVAAADALLAEVAAGGAGENWLDVYAFKLVALREPAVEARLRDALAHPVDDVRRLAARALGGLRSRASVDALVARLGAEGERSPEVVVELVNALGVIGDPRAEGPVARARFAAGQGSPVWRRTELAYRMIPLPPLPADGAGVGFDALLERGRALDNKGDHAAAVAVYSRALELEPRSAAALHDRALARRALHDLEGALADYDRALALTPGDVRTLNNRALVRKALDDHAGALADYDRVIKEGSLGALPLRNRARARVYVGDYAGALADAEAALRLEPGSAVGHSALASVHLSRNNWEQTQAALDRALAIDPGDPYALTLRATVAHARGDLAAARSDLDRVLAADPEHARAAPHRALLALGDGDVATARRLLDRAVQGHPEDATLRATRAVLLAPSLRDPTATLRDLDAALAREGDPGARAELRALRAGLELEAGRADAARATLAGLPAGPGGRYSAVLRALARGETPLDAAIEQARVPERACVAVLVAGLRAELAPAPAAARDAYARVPGLARPADPSCALAGRRSAAFPPAP